MNISFICLTLGGGGAERVIQTLSKQLVKEGHKVKIICLENTQNGYFINEHVKVVNLKSSRFMKGVFKILALPIQAYELSRELKKEPEYKAISFLVRANFAFIMTKMFGRFDVIISERNHSQTQYLGSGLKNKVFNFLIRNLYVRADKVIPISYGIEESLFNFYSVPKSLMTTIHNPQDLGAIYAIRGNNFFDSSFFNYITLGRLIDQKDHHTLINAFSKVVSSKKDSRLYILGEGCLRSKLQKQIDDLGLKDNVFLLGFKSNAFEYLKSADCFVFSSIFEGFGNVLVEAMACELPVISTRCPSGPSEILGDGKHGILVDVGDSSGLASAMLKVRQKPIYDTLRKASKKRAEDFDVKIVLAKYLSVIN